MRRIFAGVLVLAATFVSVRQGYAQDRHLKRVPISKVLQGAFSDYDPNDPSAQKSCAAEEERTPAVPSLPERILLNADRDRATPGTEVRISAKSKEGGRLKDVMFVPVRDSMSIERDRYSLSPDGTTLTVRIPENFIGEIQFGAVGFVDDEPAASNLVTILSSLEERK